MPSSPKKPNLIFLNGTMGAGKTATARALQTLLPACALLDGDSVWDFTPFCVNGRTKELAFANISAVLNNYLACGLFENIVFCWVMQRREISEELLRRLRGEYEYRPFTLCVSERELRARLERDIAAGKRGAGVLARALERLPLYKNYPSVHIDTDGKTAAETAKEIAEQLRRIRPCRNA